MHKTIATPQFRSE